MPRIAVKTRYKGKVGASFELTNPENDERVLPWALSVAAARRLAYDLICSLEEHREAQLAMPLSEVLADPS